MQSSDSRSRESRHADVKCPCVSPTRPAWGPEQATPYRNLCTDHPARHAKLTPLQIRCQDAGMCMLADACQKQIPASASVSRAIASVSSISQQFTWAMPVPASPKAMQTWEKTPMYLPRWYPMTSWYLQQPLSMSIRYLINGFYDTVAQAKWQGVRHTKHGRLDYKIMLTLMITL